MTEKTSMGLSERTLRAMKQHSEPIALDLFITPDVLTHAQPRDVCHCIVALAVKAAQPWAVNISVDAQTIRWSDKETHRRYIMATPEYVAHQIELFDNPATHASVQPFTVHLEGTVWSKPNDHRRTSPTAEEVTAMPPAKRARYERKRQTALENIGFGNTSNRYLGYRFPKSAEQTAKGTKGK